VVDRRTVFKLALGGLAAALPLRPVLAGDENALFWQIDTAGGGRGILFGYHRVAAADVPHIVDDGARFLKTVERVFIDQSDIKKTVTRPNKDLKPFLPMLPAETAEQVRALLLGMGWPADGIEQLPSAIVLFMLLGEGTQGQDDVPMVGGVLLEHAKKLGRPAGALMEKAETKRLLDMLGPDAASMDAPVRAEAMAALLSTRHEVGPIGTHFVKLYRERRIADMDRLAERLNQHGIRNTPWRNPDAALRFYVDTVAPRILAALDTDTALFFVNAGSLLRDTGLLARLRQQGARIAALA
jgi:hypothetical protein